MSFGKEEEESKGLRSAPGSQEKLHELQLQWNWTFIHLSSSALIPKVRCAPLLPLAISHCACFHLLLPAWAWLPAAVTGVPRRVYPLHHPLTCSGKMESPVFVTSHTAASKAGIFTFPWSPVSLGGSSLSHSSFSTRCSSKNYHLSVSGPLSLPSVTRWPLLVHPQHLSFYFFLI